MVPSDNEGVARRCGHDVIGLSHPLIITLDFNSSNLHSEISLRTNREECVESCVSFVMKKTCIRSCIMDVVSLKNNMHQKVCNGCCFF